MTTINQRRTRQRGMTLPMTALFIVVLFTFAALAIDVGMLYTARTSSQHVADAAALAGAFTFTTNPTATDKVTPAYNAAVGLAAQNKIMGKTVTINTLRNPPCTPDPTTSFVCVDVPNYRVTVSVASVGANAITTYFARVMGITSAGVATIATAEAGKNGVGSYCLKPIFTPNSIVAAPTDLTRTDACKNHHVLFENNQPTQWGLDYMAGKLAFQGGTVSPVLYRPLDGSSGVPSQYYSLDFGSGANTYRCTIASCLNDASCGVDASILAKIQAGTCGQQFDTENGKMTGPTDQGFGDLTQGGDTWGGAPGQYCLGGTCPPYSPVSSQNVTSAVWDDCTGPVSSGKQTVTVVGFASFFVNPQKFKSGNVTAYLTSISACGVTPTPGTGPSGVPVRLIQHID